MDDNKEIKQIIRTVKELFTKNIENSRGLSKLIDKYLIPQELEKKSHAEVSTPYSLRQDMLNKIPVDFWTPYYTIEQPNDVWTINYPKIFEPCAGKGGFLLDIIDRLMIGFKYDIADIFVFKSTSNDNFSDLRSLTLDSFST